MMIKASSSSSSHPPKVKPIYYILFITAVIAIVVVAYSVLLSADHHASSGPAGSGVKADMKPTVLKGPYVDIDHSSVLRRDGGQGTRPAVSASTQLPTTPSSPSSSAVRPITSAPRLHAVTYASHHGRDDRFCRAVESALRYEYPLTILGWQVPWKGLAQKLQAAHAYAQSIPANDLMLFTDAFDVLFTAPPQQIVRTFTDGRYRILFGAECGCWPHIMDSPKVCFETYPRSPTPYRYLNSGTWLANAADAAHMLQEVIEQAGSNFINANDQKLVADMFMAQSHPIALDYRASIFQSMHRTDPPDLPLCHPFEHIKGFKNALTNSTPGIFHFNGGGKAHHLQMEGRAWYKSRDGYADIRQMQDKLITAPSTAGGTLRFGDICGDYLKEQQRKYAKR